MMFSYLEIALLWAVLIWLLIQLVRGNYEN